MVALVLASRSAARRALLSQAGVAYEAVDAGVDEDAIKADFTGSPATLAVELAKAKALAVSNKRPGVVVLGADQTLDFEGERVSKAASLEEARARLQTMAGRSHSLHSGLALAREGAVIWTGLNSARMTMRDFSPEFLDHYLSSEGDGVLSSVGSYRLEGLGAQLFARIEGDYFTILGLPLWDLLAELRRLDVIAT
mgnify:CR=1 FL=1